MFHSYFNWITCSPYFRSLAIVTGAYRKGLQQGRSRWKDELALGAMIPTARQ